MVRLGLILNEDNSHFFGTRTETEMTREALEAFVDGYADTQVSHLFFCPNSMRTSYRSDVFDAIWDVEKPKIPLNNLFAVNWVRNTRLLNRRGLNPYTIWIDRCRSKGISPWLSMRMNDLHDASNLSSYLHSSFWLNHPEYWRVPGSNNGKWIDRAFDYSHPEVREYHMNLIREYFDRYDFDGLELDWMRFGYHFKPGHEAEGAEILTAFMSDVRDLAKVWSSKRGHAIKVGARVPADPIAARGLGMDGVRWVKEGLVDLLVPTPFRTTANFDIPLDLWRELCGKSAEKVVLAAGLELNIKPFPTAEQRPSDVESIRGFSSAAMDRGADQIYLFNYIDSNTTVDQSKEYRQLLNEAGCLETILNKPRRHIVTFIDTLPPGVATPCLLPAELKKYGQAEFRIYTGPQPTKGRAMVYVALADRPGVKDASLLARVNSENCKRLSDGENPERIFNCVRLLRFNIPLATMRQGYNLVEVFNRGEEPQEVVWMEIRIDPN